LIGGFAKNGYHVVFFPDNVAAIEPYASELQARGIEIVYKDGDDPRSRIELFLDALKNVDVAWVCRPELCCEFLPLIRANSRIPILYDTIDLHHVRMRSQALLEGSSDDRVWKRMEQLELACARMADATIVVTEHEANILDQAGVERIGVVPTIHDIEMSGNRGFTETDGLIFIGGYNHAPNVDAAKWLIETIMPMIWEKLPTLRVTLLGSNAPASLLALASERVVVPGYIPDVGPYFRTARLFVAPLRYGAGVNGKIGQALGFGLPIVTTPVGAKGFGLVHHSTAMVVETAEEFAEATLALYHDNELWEKLSAGSAIPLAPFLPQKVVKDAISILDQVMALPQY
jgi:glycosyltransferase involved in cell wall biosynthesis